MSSSTPSNTKFFIIAAATLAAAIGLTAAAWRPACAAVSYESYRLSGAAQGASPAQAQALDTLATWLDPYNLPAQRNLAALDLQTGHDIEALAAINRSGQGTQVIGLRVQAYLELGRNASAAHAASQLSIHATSDADRLLSIEALSLTGHSSEALTLMHGLTSSEALRRARYATSGNMPLAYALAATGLLRSPQAILVRLPDTFQRDLLLAHITMHLGLYPSAIAYALGAAAHDPSATAPHILLEQLYENSGNLSAMKTQQALLTHIASNKP